MIPKIIHYVWLGTEQLPMNVVERVEEWKKKLPDYSFKLWNEYNFDINSIKYVKEAYQEKKYAFASDYIRLWALYNFGGIYLDTDVEIVRDFAPLLKNSAFMGFEDEIQIATCVIGSEKGNELVKQMMEYYNERRFVYGIGNYDMTPNPVSITNILKKHGLIQKNICQNLEKVHIYTMDYFCPFNPYRAGQECFTSNTYTNHQFDGAWQLAKSEHELIHQKKQARLVRLFGKKLGYRICNFWEGITYLGPMEWLKVHMKGK